MEFCPRCSSLLAPKNGRLWCSCGFSKEGEIKIIERVKNLKRIEVVEDDVEYGDSTIPIVCWNCGHKGAYVKINYYRSDEAPIRLYKCEKCKKIWRSAK